MGDAATLSPAPELLDTCMKIIKTLHEVRPRLRPAPLTLTSITTACFGLHEALVQVQDLDIAGLEVSSHNQSHQKVRSIKAFFLGCSITVSVVEEYAMELHDAIQTVEPGDTVTVRQLWRENDMTELLHQLVDYRDKLMHLLETVTLNGVAGQQYQISSIDQADIRSLLGRSHSSFQTRPNSMRSSLRISFLDPAPPYALSLHGDAIDELMEDLHFFDLNSAEQPSAANQPATLFQLAEGLDESVMEEKRSSVILEEVVQISMASEILQDTTVKPEDDLSEHFSFEQDANSALQLMEKTEQAGILKSTPLGTSSTRPVPTSVRVQRQAARQGFQNRAAVPESPSAEAESDEYDPYRYGKTGFPPPLVSIHVSPATPLNEEALVAHGPEAALEEYERVRQTTDLLNYELGRGSLPRGHSNLPLLLENLNDMEPQEVGSAKAYLSTKENGDSEDDFWGEYDDMIEHFMSPSFSKKTRERGSAKSNHSKVDNHMRNNSSSDLIELGPVPDRRAPPSDPVAESRQSKDIEDEVASPYYESFVRLQERLSHILEFQPHFLEMENQKSYDPCDYTCLQDCLKSGLPLLTIYNSFHRQDDWLEVSPDEPKEMVGRWATFLFIKACLQNLGIPVSEIFNGSDLSGSDIQGFAKVMEVLHRVLDLRKIELAKDSMAYG